MKNLIINLKPTKGAFHIGDDLRGLERVREYVHSDTIFSGLIHSFARLYGKEYVDDLIKQFCDGKLPFIVSSGFLFNANYGYFLPKPKLPISLLKKRIKDEPQEKTEKTLKKYKETNFLPDLWLRGLLKGLSNNNIEFQILENAVREANNYSNLFSTITRPSSSIDRTSNSSELFFRGETFLKSNVEISIFCKCDDSLVKQVEVENAFKCLGDLGLGGERTYGLGHFDISVQEAPSGREFIFEGIPTLNGESNNFSYLLSLYYPDSEELEKIKDSSFYSFTERKGWFDSPYSHSQFKRKSIMMFEEGSIINSGSLKGKLVDVSPERWWKSSIKSEYKHTIFRNGLAFSIPFKM